MTNSGDPIVAWLREVVIGEIEAQPVVIRDYDSAWPERFEREREKIVSTLGDIALAVEHIGSTSVPGLAAKPIVDILLVVEDSSDEDSYLPDLESADYVLRVREPELDEHRMFRTPEKDVHLHVYSRGSREITRYILLRDRLRTNEDERGLYERTKRELSSRDWPSMNHYAVAKTGVIEGIVSRAAGEKGENPSSYSQS